MDWKEFCKKVKEEETNAIVSGPSVQIGALILWANGDVEVDTFDTTALPIFLSENRTYEQMLQLLEVLK